MPNLAIGQPLPRVEGPQKVTGETHYTADLRLPGMLHVRLVVSPYAHARIVRISTEAAAQVPGVVGIFTGRDLRIARPDPSSRSRMPLATERAIFNGHPVAAVVAESEAVAEDAAALVEVEYQELPAAVDPERAMAPDAPVVHEGGNEGSSEELAMHGAATGGQSVDEDLGPNVAGTVKFTRGDLDQGFREADVVVEQRFTTAMLHQGYLEPRAAVANVDPVGSVTVWTSTQALFATRDEIAATLGLPHHQVKVVAMPVGGAFGGKFVLLEPLAALLAVSLRRPVSVVMTRTEEFLSTTPAPQCSIEARLGARRDGSLTALQARVVYDAGAFSGAPTGITCNLMGGYYRVPNLELKGYEVLTHKPGNGAYRAPGAVQASFAIESLMDELARRLELDPLELRLQNASDEGDPLPDGQLWPRIGLRACLERLKELRGAAPRLEPAASQERSSAQHSSLVTCHSAPARGTGMGVGGWLGGLQPANAVCRLNTDGTLTLVLGSVDLNGTNTGLGQIAAEAFGVEADLVQVIPGDTDTAPYSGVTGGSKITYTVGAAVKLAAEDARRQLLDIAADHLEAAVDDLEITDRTVRVRGAPDRAVSLRKVARLSTDFGSKYTPVFGRGAISITQRAPGFAVHLSEVEVDPDTGDARVTRHLVVQDVGKAINPANIEGQVRGAVAQGIGWALLERMAYDEDGRLLSASMLDYALPASDQVPPTEVVLVEVPSQLGPFGAKGVGEPPVVGAAAAIANALADATGKRFTSLPVAAQDVLSALNGE